tara:strand:- start:2189 stop:2410 length:222 start_codon:yes stop_codon:yes gene_type:complete
MARTDIFKIVLVMVVLAPLVVIQSGPGMTPNWMTGRWAGVPITVIATGLWFVTMMSLTAIFARLGMADNGGDE